MNEFQNYKKFFSKNEVELIIDVLNDKNIPYKIIDTSPLDLIFTVNNSKEYWLQILNEDFRKVDKLIENEFQEGEMEPEHYLNEFTNTELHEIFEKFEEWNQSDIALAKQILAKRGIEITESKIEELRKERIAELAKPERVKIAWIVAGYIFALLGGFIAVVIGISISNTKKTLPDGRRVFSFDKKGRFHAKNILFIGIFFSNNNEITAIIL